MKQKHKKSIKFKIHSLTYNMKKCQKTKNNNCVQTLLKNERFIFILHIKIIYCS